MKLLYIILSLCIYTQSFGYYTLSVTSNHESHNEVKPTQSHKKHFCCSSKTTKSCETSATTSPCHLVKDTKVKCSQDQDSNKKSKGCCGGEDCDCQCCFHIPALQVLYFSSYKSAHFQNLENYYKSRFNFKDAIYRDLSANVFHPPKV